MIKLKDLLSEGKLTEAKGKWAVINANDVLNMFAEKVVDTQKEAEKIAKQMKQKDKYGKYQAVSVKRWNQAKPGNKIKEGKLTEAKKFRVYDTNTGKTIKIVNSEKAGWKFIDILYKKYGNPDAGLAKVYEGKLNEGKTLTLPNGIKVTLDFKGVTFKSRTSKPVFLDRDELLKFFRGSTKYLRYT